MECKWKSLGRSLAGKIDVNGRRALATKITIEKNSIDGETFYLFKALAQTFRQVRSETWFVQAHMIYLCSRGNREPPLLACDSNDVYRTARSFPIRWFLHMLGQCPGHLCFSCVLYSATGLACEANYQRSAQRSVRSVGISDRSVGDLRWTGRKHWNWKELDAASRFESFFSLLLECKRSAGETAHQCRYTGHPCSSEAKSFASLQLVWMGWRN